MKPKIAAGIVLYNPDNIERFNKCLNSILLQIEQIYIFDNSSNNLNLSLPGNVIYMSKNRNTGISYALNRIMEAAERDGFTWVVTMDQDSILPPGIVDIYKEQIIQNKNLGIVCPQVIDSRRKYMIPQLEPPIEFVDSCITSASCTSVAIWDKIGRFDEWLFIDLVDNEFCKRLICTGYKILRINTSILDQEFGKILPKPKRSQLFWIKMSKILHNDNIAKFSYQKYVSPLRVYYTCRNIIYVNRKMKKYGTTAYQNYNCKGYWGFIISFIIPSIVRADKKAAVFKAVCKGTYAGLKEKVKPWTVENP